MIPELRRAYNESFSEARHQDYVRRLEAAVGRPIEFRLAETPVFLPPVLRDRILKSAREIVAQLESPEHARASLAAVPPEFDAPGCDEKPLFAVVDFAITGSAAPGFGAKLIELQAFPSLYGFQVFQGRELRRSVPGGEDLSFVLSGLDEDAYLRVVGGAILGGHAPEAVVLLDLEPETQKTACDFAATEKLWGIRAVCPTRLVRRGRELWYERDGSLARVRRIYNRVIVDELLAKDVKLPFSYSEPLDVEWAGHPNWYFRWSKHSIPYLSHPDVPEAHFLSDLKAAPDDLAGWVLKPLFSFAGSGVKVEPAPEDLAAVPEASRRHVLLMRKVEYAPAIATADGQFSKAEVRVLMVRHQDALLPLTTLIRLSQGKMMGVDYNKNKTWVGSSCGLWPA
jgi:hypothetical protein